MHTAPNNNKIFGCKHSDTVVDKLAPWSYVNKWLVKAFKKHL